MKKKLTQSQLSSYLDNAIVHVQAVPLSQLLKQQAICCVDGRNFNRVVAAPGGNAGLFLQMLTTYEKYTDQLLSPEQIPPLFAAYLDRFGHFYLHSDVHALQAIVLALQQQNIPISSVEQLISHISAPSGTLRAQLLTHLSQPAYIGCGHIRLMLENHGSYEIRPELIQLFLQEFFRRFWTGDERLQFDILQGDHAEQAILNICTLEKEDIDKTSLILVAPQLMDTQVFINHPAASAYMHNQHASFLKQEEYLNESDLEAFLHVHENIHNTHITSTVAALGKGLPVFDVVLNETHTVQRLELLGEVQ